MEHSEPHDGDLGLRLSLEDEDDEDERAPVAAPPPPPAAQRIAPTAPPAAPAAAQTAPITRTTPLKPSHTRTETLTRRISFPHADLDPLTLARLRRVLTTCAIVEFDIDTGPNLDNTYPATRFPPNVRQNIAFSSLPEGALLPPPGSPALTSNGTDDPAGYAYTWKIPYPSEDDLASTEAVSADRKPNLRLPGSDNNSAGALYGYAWFVREKDLNSRRGYAQRSLVLITHLPAMSGLFSSLAAILGPLHFKHAQIGGANGGMVETACHNIASWPDLVLGTTVELPFLGSVLTVSVPLPHQVQLPRPLSLASPHLPYTHPPSPFLSQQAWTASDRPGAPPRRRRRAATVSNGAAAAAVDEAEGLPASLPLTPLCTLLFTPGPEALAAEAAKRRAAAGLEGGGGGGTARSAIMRKSPSLGSSSTSPSLPFSAATAPTSALSASASSSSSSSSPLGAVDFSSLLVLWEILVLGEPLMVWSGDPRTGSEAVEALKALIRPIPFAGDDRPYFHVHDADFARLCRPGSKPPHGLLIAATNPLLLTTCKHWPHILRLDRPTPLAASPAPVALGHDSPRDAPSRSASLSVPAARGSVPSSRDASPSPSLAGSRTPQRSSSVGSKFEHSPRMAASAAAAALGEKSAFGLKTGRKRHVKKDEAVRKEIEALWLAGDYPGCDAAIYRYFASLTEQFLAPLNRYFGTLWAGNELVARNTPLLSPGPRPAPSTRFSSASFLASLRAHGCSLSLRSSAPSLSQPGTSPLDRFYLRFIDHSPHFQRWLRDRIEVTGDEVRRRYVRELESVDVEVWARERRLAEVEEMVGTLEREVTQRLEPTPIVLADPPASRTTAAAAAAGAEARPTETAPDSSPAVDSGPAAKLRAQARRLRSIRDAQQALAT